MNLQDFACKMSDLIWGGELAWDRDGGLEALADRIKQKINQNKSIKSKKVKQTEEEGRVGDNVLPIKIKTPPFYDKDSCADIKVAEHAMSNMDSIDLVQKIRYSDQKRRSVLFFNHYRDRASFGVTVKEIREIANQLCIMAEKLEKFNQRPVYVEEGAEYYK